MVGGREHQGMPDVALITSSSPWYAAGRATFAHALPCLLTHPNDVLLTRVRYNTSTAAAVFTRNQFQAAPVLVSKDQLSKHASGISTVLVNSGCANACTGERGLADARTTVQRLAQAGLGNGLIMSTGTRGRACGRALWGRQ